MRNPRLREAVPLCDCKGNFLQMIPPARGQQKVADGTATAVKSRSCGRVRVVRYIETEGATPSASRPSMAAMTVSDMLALAGCTGRRWEQQRARNKLLGWSRASVPLIYADAARA